MTLNQSLKFSTNLDLVMIYLAHATRGRSYLKERRKKKLSKLSWLTPLEFLVTQAVGKTWKSLEFHFSISSSGKAWKKLKGQKGLESLEFCLVQLIKNIFYLEFWKIWSENVWNLLFHILQTPCYYNITRVILPSNKIYVWKV